MIKQIIFIVPCVVFLLTGCSNTKKIQHDESAACNSEDSLAIYHQFLDELNRGHSNTQKYLTRSSYGAILGNRCQTFTKGMTVTVLEEKTIKGKFSASLIETSDKKTYWMFSSDIE